MPRKVSTQHCSWATQEASVAALGGNRPAYNHDSVGARGTSPRLPRAGVAARADHAGMRAQGIGDPVDAEHLRYGSASLRPRRRYRAIATAAAAGLGDRGHDRFTVMTLRLERRHQVNSDRQARASRRQHPASPANGSSTSAAACRPASPKSVNAVAARPCRSAGDAASETPPSADRGPKRDACCPRAMGYRCLDRPRASSPGG